MSFCGFYSGIIQNKGFICCENTKIDIFFKWSVFNFISGSFKSTERKKDNANDVALGSHSWDVSTYEKLWIIKI